MIFQSEVAQFVRNRNVGVRHGATRFFHRRANLLRTRHGPHYIPYLLPVFLYYGGLYPVRYGIRSIEFNNLVFKVAVSRVNRVPICNLFMRANALFFRKFLV